MCINISTHLLSYKVIYFRPNSSQNFKMAAIKTLFDHLSVPINAKMTIYMFLRHIRCPLLCSHTY